MVGLGAKEPFEGWSDAELLAFLGLPEDVPDDVLEAFCARLVGQGGSDAGTGTGQATAPRARARRRNSAAQQ